MLPNQYLDTIRAALDFRRAWAQQMHNDSHDPYYVEMIAELDAALSAFEQVTAEPIRADGDSLLPCPHCGSAARLYDYDTEIDAWPVECDNPECWASVRSRDSQDAARAAWNRRATAPSAAATGRGMPTIPPAIAMQMRVLMDYAEMTAAPNGAMQAVRKVAAWLDTLEQHPSAQDGR